MRDSAKSWIPNDVCGSSRLGGARGAAPVWENAAESERTERRKMNGLSERNSRIMQIFLASIAASAGVGTKFGCHLYVRYENADFMRSELRPLCNRLSVSLALRRAAE